MFYKNLLLVLLMVVLAVPMVGYAQDDAAEIVLLIGTVTDVPDEFVGLAIDGENVTFYICDGKADEGTVSIAQWFVGTHTDGVIDITAPNSNHLELTVTEDSAAGKITFADGSVKEFTLALAEDQAALYRSEFALGEDEFVGGWLVLADGDVRGAIFKVGTEELSPASLVGGPPARR